MVKLELKKQLNQMVEQMPESLVREIVDFAEFLLTKEVNEGEKIPAETRKESRDEMWHLEEEFLNYKMLFLSLIHI